MFIRTILRVALATVLLGCSAALHAEQYTVPLFVAAGPGGDPQGVLRLVSDSERAGTVAIHAIDDAGVRTGPATLTLNALSAVELSATELQSGSAAKGLSAGLGSLSGEVRLSIDSDVPVVPSVYVRKADGTLSAMNATVLEAAGTGQAVRSGRNAFRYDVAVFHPASNAMQPSRLRLINPGDAAARVTIAARDDTGASATGGTVELTLPAGGARTLSARQLEAGDSSAFTGRLGAGVGNWRLSVMSDRPIQAVNVAVGLSGEWRNLSTTAVSGWAPETAAAFEARFLGRTIVSRNGQDRVTFQVLANNRLLHTYMDDGVEVRQQSRYEYERTGRDAGLLNLDYDAGLSCEARFHFGSRRSGWYAFACVDAEDRVEIWTGATWLSLDAEATPLELGSGPDDLIYVEGTAIDALTLPAASGGEGELTYSLAPQVPGLSFDPDTRRLSGTPAEAGIWTMTYRVRDASGDTDWLYFVLAVDTATVGRETTHTVGATLSDLPSGSWTPDVISNGSFSLSGGDATVRLVEGGYIEAGGQRYTCQSSGGCVIENRGVTSGTVVQTAQGTAQGGGDTQRQEWRLAIFHSLRVSDTSLTAGQAFTLDTTVQKRQANSLIVNLRYFRSLDDIIDPGDAFIHSDWRLVDPETTAIQTVSLDWTAPPYAGTYYYGVCEGWDVELSECSSGVRVTVEGNEDGAPDLAFLPPHVSHTSVMPGSRYTWTARIENIGTGPAAATSHRYYLSDDATIDATDRLVGIFRAPHTKSKEAADNGYAHTHTHTSNAPSVEGTYYVGFCVDPVPGETNIENNCSIGVPLIVEFGDRGNPDLIVRLPIFEMPNLDTGDPRIGPAVINIGSRASAETTVRLYRSANATFDVTDTPYETYDLGSVAVETFAHAWFYPSIPSSPGTYHFTACVDPVAGESNTENNCSETRPVNVGVPDLAVSLAWVSMSALVAEQSFELTATVRNQGPEAAGSTTLRYYRSDDATIDAADTPVGAEEIRSLTGLDGLYGGPGHRLAASGTSRAFIRLSAPSTPGTYYYGACVDGVPGEANTDNNCSAGAYVRVAPTGDDPFNIELVFEGNFTDAHKDVMQQAARRWETIITEGLPEVDFSTNEFDIFDDDGNVRTSVNDAVDDLRVFVHRTDLGGAAGRGGPAYVREGSPIGLPALGQVWIAPSFSARRAEELLFKEESDLYDLMLHEIAHVLGYGTLWGDLGLVHEPLGDTYFSGELAIAAFNAAGGEDYSGNKVPLESGFLGGGCAVAAHWHPYVFRGLDRQFGAELMEPTIEQEHALSAITLQSIADLGYAIDVSKADPYRLPASVNTVRPPTASAKPVASHDFDSGAHDTIYVGDEQGQVIRTIEP